MTSRSLDAYKSRSTTEHAGITKRTKGTYSICLQTFSDKFTEAPSVTWWGKAVHRR